MKMKTIEQKAKAYDEAKARMSRAYNDNRCTIGFMNEIFPELKESEDERMRKHIIKVLKDNFSGEDTDKCIAWLEKQKVLTTEEYLQGKEDVLWCIKKAKKHAKDENEMGTCWFAEKWLEKQGEQKPTDEVEHLIPQKGMYYTCIKDYYSSDNTHLCVKGNVYKSSFNGYIDDESHFGLSWTNSCAEKYFEPTKDEDWIVCEHDNVIGKPIQYKEFKKKVNQKYIKNLKALGLTPKLRLWNLQDAKDGDVLYAKGSYFKEYLFMFSSFTEDNVVSTHFGYDVFHGTFDTKLSRFGRKEDFVSIIPATKEQREQLEKAMANAGYTFDFEKKELKKIEQKPADKIEPKFHKGDIIKPKDGAHEPWQVMQVDIFDKKYRFKDGYVINFSQEDDYELLEQKTTWNEEDEHGFENCLYAIKETFKGVDNPHRIGTINWLKSLKDRVQPNQDWSEEDENEVAILEAYIRSNDWSEAHINRALGIVDELVNKVKSIKSQPTWKPSEEQLRELENVFSPYTDSWDEDILRELHKQLKQL